MRPLLPRGRPFWAIAKHTTGPVFDIWWLGWFQFSCYHDDRLNPRGWSLDWNDD